ncbi:MAG TPA: gluconate:H+ symporter [Telmatospirillum sp.]|nr:gluconate:H+ symporter [Telmatospirillum sp.]
MTPVVTQIVISALAIVLLVLLITRLKLHPFPALIIAAGFLGIASGLAPTNVIKTFEKGFGGILSSVGLVIGLGCMLGGLLLNSGGADRIANAFVGFGSKRWIPTSVCAAALLIGMPHLFDVSFVMLVPLTYVIAKRTNSHLLWVGLPMAAGLYVSHGLLLPHPSPTLAMAAFHADAGRLVFYGFLLAIPVAVISGPLLTSVVMRWFPNPIDLNASPLMALGQSKPADGDKQAPALWLALLTILLPPGLMMARTALRPLLPASGMSHEIAETIGDPIVSLLIAVLFAIFALGLRSGIDLKGIQKLLGKSLAPGANVILVVGAGGGLKEMLIATHVGDLIAQGAMQWNLSPLILAWGVAAVLRIAVGSATVATVTAAGIVAPIAALQPGTNLELLVLAASTGGLMLSHLNDSGFWLFKEFFQLSVAETLKSWTLLVSLQSVLGLIGILAVNAIVG